MFVWLIIVKFLSFQRSITMVSLLARIAILLCIISAASVAERESCPENARLRCGFDYDYYNCGYAVKNMKRFSFPHRGKNCTWACICNDGFARYENSKDRPCISKRDCYRAINQEEMAAFPVTQHQKCAENEVFECTFGYKDQVCHRIADCKLGPGSRIVRPCTPRCQCKKGYARDENNRCVPHWQCHKTAFEKLPKKNNRKPRQCSSHLEQYGCMWKPDHKCSEVAKCSHNRRMPPRGGSCQMGCRCNTGYARDEKGNCVPQWECHAKAAGWIY